MTFPDNTGSHKRPFGLHTGSDVWPFRWMIARLTAGPGSRLTHRVRHFEPTRRPSTGVVDKLVNHLTKRFSNCFHTLVKLTWVKALMQDECINIMMIKTC